MLISIIIPVYNAGNFLERCLKSVFLQKGDNYELVIVDDCSTDNSLAVIDSCLCKYNIHHIDTKIIKKERNSGVAHTRTIGMKAAQGQYLIHVDADDYVASNYIEELEKAVCSGVHDIIVFNYKELHSSNSTFSKKVHVAVDHIDYTCQSIIGKIHNSLCNKLIKKELIDKYNLYPLSGISIFEDKSVCFRAFYHANKIKHIDCALYFYDRTTEGSVTKQGGVKQVKSALQLMNFIDVFFDKNKANVSTEIKDAIQVNKIHIYGLTLFYGTAQQLASVEILPQFSLKDIFVRSGRTIPFHYKLIVFFHQKRLRILESFTKFLFLKFKTVI